MNLNDYQSALIVQQAKYVSVASMLLLIYDYALTIQDEVEYIWPYKLTLANALFFGSRYVAFAEIPLSLYRAWSTSYASDNCTASNIATTWLMISIFIMASGIMVLRTYAVLGCTRRGFYWLTGTTAAFCISVIVVYSLGQSQSPEVYKGCWNGPKMTESITGYSLLTASALLMIISTTIRALRTEATKLDPSHPTVVLYREGIFYFALIIIVTASNITVLVGLPSQYSNLLSDFQLVMHSILGCRMLIHIRQLFHVPAPNEVTTAISDMLYITPQLETRADGDEGEIIGQVRDSGPSRPTF